ncbi:hypothetical protein DL96DRAFT_1584439, partial [Flagelloscypha sp. PMI_526]
MENVHTGILDSVCCYPKASKPGEALNGHDLQSDSSRTSLKYHELWGVSKPNNLSLSTRPANISRRSRESIQATYPTHLLWYSCYNFPSPELAYSGFFKRLYFQLTSSIWSEEGFMAVFAIANQIEELCILCTEDEWCYNIRRFPNLSISPLTRLQHVAVNFDIWDIVNHLSSDALGISLRWIVDQ